jgi:hypothetical protein
MCKGRILKKTEHVKNVSQAPSRFGGQHGQGPSEHDCAGSHVPLTLKDVRLNVEPGIAPRSLAVDSRAIRSRVTDLRLPAAKKRRAQSRGLGYNGSGVGGEMWHKSAGKERV